MIAIAFAVFWEGKESGGKNARARASESEMTVR
jgi:hypothetical protein